MLSFIFLPVAYFVAPFWIAFSTGVIFPLVFVYGTGIVGLILLNKGSKMLGEDIE